MYQRECQGKRRYRSEKDALAAAASQMRAYPETPDLSAYRCSYCSSWHLTKLASEKDNT